MDFKKQILIKLFRHRIIGGKHTAFEHAISGVPKDHADKAKEAAKELIKEGLIIAKPTNYGLQISLNPDRIDEIMIIIN
ncbi:hypothetical protein HY484_04345 [Candidatus Woesearchaeota archaeon]|nr:hypothetical protein [Candidatus Woesearchaeota archaeon]